MYLHKMMLSAAQSLNIAFCTTPTTTSKRLCLLCSKYVAVTIRRADIFAFLGHSCRLQTLNVGFLVVNVLISRGEERGISFWVHRCEKYSSKILNV